MRAMLTILGFTVLLGACGKDPQEREAAGKAAAGPASTAHIEGTPATRTQNLPLARCLEEQSTVEDIGPLECPTYILLALDFMVQNCVAAGGTLQPNEEPEAWALDVDHDGRSEVLVDLTRNYTCYGAPAVFSCGSLGCPYFLYTPRGEGWVEIGALEADDAPGVEVLPGPEGKPATLRGGCLGERPCSELAHYESKANVYDRSWIEFRGHIVDVVPGGLWTLTKESRVLTAPGKGGQTIDEYPEGTTVVVIGNARTGNYKYVSPCNACRRGFVANDALRKD